MRIVGVLITLGLMLGAMAFLVAQDARPNRPFPVVETGIPELRAALEQKRTTSRALVTAYLVRIV